MLCQQASLLPSDGILPPQDQLPLLYDLATLKTWPLVLQLLVSLILLRNS